MLKKSSRIFGHKAEEKIQEKYKSKSEFIQNKLALRGKKAPSTDKKKVLRKELKALNEKINSEIKTQIKQAFHYEIPIAEVEKAGISTTGAKIDNELEPLAKEFTKYRKQNKLWEEKFDAISYDTDDKGILYRTILTGGGNSVKEPEIFYGK